MSTWIGLGKTWRITGGSLLFLLGVVGWRCESWAENPGLSTGRSNRPEVRVSFGKYLRSEPQDMSLGFCLFTNLEVNVSQQPVMQVEVVGTRESWSVYAGIHGEALTNVFTSAGSSRGMINLLLSQGWKGEQRLDVLVQVRESLGAIRFDLSGEADKDLVFEDGKNAGATAFGEGSNSLQCLVEEGRRFKTRTAKGLPSSRLVKSTDLELGNYQLLSYTTLNAIELPAFEKGEGETHILDVPDMRYAKIGMLTASQNGDSSFTIKLFYQDGTVSTNWFEADDWCRKSRVSNKEVLKGMDWAMAADGAVEKVGCVQLYEFILPEVDADRILDRIAVGNDPHRWPDGEARCGAVFAINGFANLLQGRP